MSAFDLMVLTWVFKVLEAKGLDKRVIERLRNMYKDHLTVVVVNNIRGQCFPGCVLHRDTTTSGMAKFLSLGQRRGTLQQEDLPVRYIVQG